MSRSLVNRATTDDQKGVNGLLLKQLADKTLESIVECQNIQSMLLAKLAKPSPDVKLKALNCIKFIAQNGRDDFRITLQRECAKIREHTTIRGVADPLRGELPFDKVREAAKETMNAIFNSTGRIAEKSAANRMTGYGGGEEGGSSGGSSSGKSFSSGTFSPGSDHVGPSGKVMDAMGNYDPSKDKTWVEKMKDKVIKDQPPATYKPYVKPIAYGEAQFPGFGGGVDVAPAMTEAVRRRGEVGGVWADEGSAPARVAAPASGQKPFSAAIVRPTEWTCSACTFINTSDRTLCQMCHKPAVVVSASGNAQSSARNKGAQPTEFERKIVDEITAPSGVRVTVSPQELAGFLRKCESLEVYMIAGLLSEKLEDDSNHASQQKALHCLEGMLSTERFAADVEEFLSDHEEGIARLLENSNKAVRAKALKIMVSIGLRESESEPAYQEPPQASRPGPATASILPFAATETAPSFSFVTPAAAPVVSAFDFTASPPAAASSFPFASTTSTSTSSSFGFVSDPPATTVPSSAFPFAAATSGSASTSSAFGFVSSTPPPTAPVSAFNFTAPNATQSSSGLAPSTAAPAPQAPAAGSAFNFLSAGPAPQKQATPASPFFPSATPGPASFAFTQPAAPAPDVLGDFLPPANNGPSPLLRDSVAALLIGSKSSTLPPAASSFPQPQQSYQFPPFQQQPGFQQQGSFQQPAFQQQSFQQPAPFQQQAFQQPFQQPAPFQPPFQQPAPFQQQQAPFQANFQQSRPAVFHLPPLSTLPPPTRPGGVDNFLGIGAGQPAKPNPKTDSFAFVKEEMTRN